MIFGTPEFDELLVRVIREDYRHPLYDETCEHAEEMAVHLYAKKPIELLERMRPNEEVEVRDYRLESYEPTTKAPTDKALHILSKIFNPSLSSIRFPEENKSTTQKEFEDYITKNYPTYNSVQNYNKDVVLRKMLADPNAVMAIKFKKMPARTSETPQAVAVIYGSPNVWYYDEDCFLFFIKEEERQDPTRTVYYFQYVDAERWVGFQAWVNNKTLELIVEEDKEHANGTPEIPAWFLRGMSEQKDNGEIIYKSFISSALPHLNLAIIHQSDLFGAFIKHLHPQKSVLSDECGYSEMYEGQRYSCRKGKIKHPIHGNESYEKDCPQCHGAGLVSVKSPYGEYRYNREKLDESTSSRPPVEYLVIPTEPTKLLKEEVKDHIRMAMWSINMDVEDTVGENQSGVAKAIDRSGQYDTLYNVSHVIFTVTLPNQLYFINKFMFGVQAKSSNKKVEDNLPQVSEPTQFDISSTSELINNFSVANKSGLDRNYQQTKQIQIASKDLATNPDLMNKVITMLELDPLPMTTAQELDFVSQFASETDVIIHVNMMSFFQRAIEEHPDFVNLVRSEQMKILKTFAEEVASEQKMKLEALTIPDDTNQFSQGS